MNDFDFADLGGRFERADRQLFLVGGSVRDMMLGREAKDLDFTTDALPDEIEAILRHDGFASAIWDAGREFGTIAARIGDETVEITTFRFDGPGRHPEVKFTDSLEEDLIRRDFTINAMAIQVFGGTIMPGLGSDVCDLVDPFGGLIDLEIGVLRTPRKPEDSFGDDPLRMLRAARFAAQLNFNVETKVKTAMKVLAPRLDEISAERVQAEMDKLLVSMWPEKGLRILHETGLLERILPELEWVDWVLLGEDAETRWAHLLRDVDPELAEVRLRKLKFSNDRVRDVGALIRLRNKWSKAQRWTPASIRRVIAESGDQFFRLVKLLRASDTLLPLATKLMATEGPLEPFLTGREVMDILDLKPGPQVGEALQWLWELRLEAGPMPRDKVEEALGDWEWSVHA